MEKMTGPLKSWEELCKTARKTENEIDGKLHSLTKLGASLGMREQNERSDTVPLLNGSCNESLFDSVAFDVEQMLTKLSDVINNMTDYVHSEDNATSNATLLHALQRHQDILQYYASDFQKIKVNVKNKKDRDSLLGSVRKDIESYRNSSSLTRRSDLLLKENEHIRNSDILVDEQISIAMDLKHHLLDQRLTFKSIQGKINTLANRFPIINSLVQRISFRKRRDSFILGVVIGVCLILLLFYTLH